MSADTLTEGAETITVTLDATDANGVTAGLSASSTINDTSLTNFTITYDPNIQPSQLSGSGFTTTHADGSTATIAAPSFGATNGWVFKEWSPFSNGSTVQYDPGDTLTITADVTLYAIWTQPSYLSLAASPSAVTDEGQNVTVILSGTDVPNGRTVDWTITGVDGGDISGALTGTFTMNGDQAQYLISINNDNLTEGTETLTFTCAAADNAGTTNGLTLDITINDTSLTPISNYNVTYQVQPGPSYTITGSHPNTVSYADGTTFTLAGPTWSVAGYTFDGYAISSNLNAPVQYQPGDQYTINGADVDFYSRYTAIPTYTTFNGPATRLEGQNAQYALQGTNIPNGTQVGYTITGVDLSDISLNSLTGFITMNSNFGQLFFTCLEDNTVDGPDTMVVTLNNVDSAGNTTGLTPTLSVSTVISDVAPGYSIAGPASINEGAIGSYTFTATNMVAGTTVYWELRNYGASNTFVEFNSDFVTARIGNGQVQATSNPGEVELGIDIEVASDMASESGENFVLIVWDDASNYDTLLPYSAPVNGALATKNITITEVPFSHNLAAYNGTQGVWGGSNGYQNETPNTTYEFQHFILNNDNDPNNPGDLLFPTGTTVYWRVEPYTAGTGNSAVEAEDFVGDVFPSGSYQTVPAGQGFSASTQAVGVWSVTIKEDNLTDGTSQELYWMKIYSDAQYTNQLAQMTVSVQDTSQTPAAQSYYFHLGAGGLPVAQNMITAPANQFYMTGGAQPTSTPPFEEVWADMMANPASYTGGPNNMTAPQSILLSTGTQFTIPAHGLANFYWLVVPSNAGVPDLTANAKLSLDSAPVDVCAEKVDFQYNGITHTLYRLNTATLTGSLLVEYI